MAGTHVRKSQGHSFFCIIYAVAAPSANSFAGFPRLSQPPLALDGSHAGDEIESAYRGTLGRRRQRGLQVYDVFTPYNVKK